MLGTSSEIQWMKLCKQFFGVENVIFLAYVYIAPSNLSYVLRKKLDIMRILETDLDKYSDLGDIIICDDTNARTGVEMEGLDNSDSDKYIPFPLIYQTVKV